MQSLKIGYATSAYNEELNLEEFYTRCKAAFSEIQSEWKEKFDLDYRMVIVDNGSTDNTLNVLQNLVNADSRITGITNATNYGAEPSFAIALNEAAKDCDLIIFLCSDLQDPPELAIKMVRDLLLNETYDACLSLKQKSAGGPLLRALRHSYYKILGYSSRLQIVPDGFHGFGCYQSRVVSDSLNYWHETGLNLRTCIANASQTPTYIFYEQPDRLRGKSSYSILGYVQFATRTLLAADAAGSRLALTIGSTGLMVALAVAMFLLLNYLSGNSKYQGGVPTVMALVLGSFGIQMLMFAVVSRQIESLRFHNFRPRVRHRQLKMNDK
jgi:glycosyltransferase involved in cell wall biosynthesis